MAHPWIFESNFEAGTNAEWDTETDTGSLLDFPHYTTLAKDPNGLMPFRGAYCMRIQPGDTNDHTVTEGDIDIADGATRYFRWYMGFSSDFTATADDLFNIFELQQADGTREMSVGMRITAASNLLEIGIGDGVAPSTYVEWPARKKWVCVEILATVSTSDAGVLTLFLDGAQVATLTSLDQAAGVGQGVLGTQDTLSTTATGSIYFDQFVMDDARIFPYRERFPANWVFTKSTHIFVGPGTLDGAELLTTAANDTLILYDSDTANSNDAQGQVAELVISQHTAVSGPLHFQRGCYASLTAGARAEVHITRSSDKPGIRGVQTLSDGGMRRYAHLRKDRPQNV